MSSGFDDWEPTKTPDHIRRIMPRGDSKSLVRIPSLPSLFLWATPTTLLSYFSVLARLLAESFSSL